MKNNDKNKVILMFPGQGSQYIGMGSEFLNENKDYSKYFDIASEAFGEDLIGIINNKDNTGGLLDQTRYSQITIYCLSCALNDYLFNIGGLQQSSVKAVIGHSLGDYSALYSCGAYDFGKGARLVSYRGKIMSDFASTGSPERQNKMMMSAVLGSDFETIESVLQNFKNKVFVANFNEYSQTVISGLYEDVLKAGEEIKKMGAKRVLPLKVSIASHCPLMADVSLNLEEYIRTQFQEFNDLKLKFYSSTELSFIDKDTISQTLVKQLVSPVKWASAIEEIMADDVAVFIEVGPGKVLSGLVKRIASKLGREDIMVFNTDNIDGINGIKDYLGR